MKVGSEALQEALCCCSQWVQWVFSDVKYTALHWQLVPLCRSPISRTIFSAASPRFQFWGRHYARLDYQVAGRYSVLTVTLCPALHGNMVGFTWHLDHAAAEPQMNASLYLLPLGAGAKRGSLGLPSLCYRGCVRGERLHSVYIIKARHTHTLTQRPSDTEPPSIWLHLWLSVVFLLFFFS